MNIAPLLLLNASVSKTDQKVCYNDGKFHVCQKPLERLSLPGFYRETGQFHLINIHGYNKKLINNSGLSVVTNKDANKRTFRQTK